MFYKTLFLSVVISFLFSCKNTSSYEMNQVNGDAFGTTFSVKYIGKEQANYVSSWDSLITVINHSMSTYQNDSDISRINKGDATIIVDAHFINVFKASEALYKETNGAFDPTVGVLVNAWNFGPEGEITTLDSLKIDSLLITVGLDNVKLVENKVHKKYKNTFLDFNALAKGYAVDVFSDFLESRGYENYLVEIGGEIRGKGINLIKQQPWKIGVEDPNFDGTQSYSKIIMLRDNAMATSGSYRKFKVDTLGNKYAHIINPKTGYPHQSNLLSVSVITDTCMEADAYATAFMSMGLEQSKEFLVSHTELKVFFIYENQDHKLKTVSINQFPE